MAIAGGLTGAKAAYSDEILFNKTIQVLQNQMRTNRFRVASRILPRIGSPSSAYTLGMALSDLDDYYNAGTITSALLAVSNTVGQDAINAKYAKDGATVIPVPASDTSFTTLYSLLYPGGIPNSKLIDYVGDLLGKNKVNYGIYFNDPKYSGLRGKIIQCIVVVGTSKQCKPAFLESATPDS